MSQQPTPTHTGLRSPFQEVPLLPWLTSAPSVPAHKASVSLLTKPLYLLTKPVLLQGAQPEAEQPSTAPARSQAGNLSEASSPVSHAHDGPVTATAVADHLATSSKLTSKQDLRRAAGKTALETLLAGNERFSKALMVAGVCACCEEH